MPNKSIQRVLRKPLKKAPAPPKSSTTLATSEEESKQMDRAQRLILGQVEIVSNEMTAAQKADFLEALRRAVYTQKPELTPEQKEAGFRRGRVA